VHKPYPISDQKGSKTIPFGAAHTYIAYNKGVTPPEAGELLQKLCGKWNSTHPK